MTAAEGGSNQFVPNVLSHPEVQDMYLTGLENTRIWTDSNRNFTLRQYGRLEYGTPEVGWLLTSAKTPRARRTRSTRSLRLRLRYFLNSFRGFAAFDIHGHDESGH